MTQPSKPRALTYTEMMNGGRQQLEQEEDMREQELQQKLNELQCDDNHRPLRQQGSSAVVHAPNAGPRARRNMNQLFSGREITA